MNHLMHPHETALVTEPPHLQGRWRRDPLMRLITGIGKTWFPFWGSLEPLRETAENNGIQVLEIVGREVVANDDNVIALTFAAPDRSVLPEWHAGAHLDLLLPSGRMREYSLCGDPGDRTTYRIAVRRIPDAAVRWKSTTTSPSATPSRSRGRATRSRWRCPATARRWDA